MATDNDLLFWQRLLSSEAPPERVWAVAERFWSDDPDPWTPLTDRERNNAQGACLPLGFEALDPHVVDARSRPRLFSTRGSAPGAFVLGDPDTLDRPLVGIVGTRSASPYGREAAAAFSRELARSGAAVLSGGAIGIDASAHLAAIDSGSPTVAVLPCGADVDYPARHRDLFSRVRSQGCVVSRFPLGAGLREHWLPWRNRLVAELCQALIVVEAPEGSGSLMTAGYARESGTPVFVVPGPVTGGGFRGSHELVRQGATLVHEPSQVTASLGLVGSVKPLNDRDLGAVEAQVLAAVSGLPRSAEAIGDETGLSVAEVLNALTLLEMEDAVYRSVEGYARRA